jgi:inorganic pyrophosphatase
VPTRILGALEMIDDGETDTKLIGVIDVDPRCSNIQSIDDLPSHILKEIKDFFETYKRLQNKKVIVRDFKNLP